MTDQQEPLWIMFDRIYWDDLTGETLLRDGEDWEAVITALADWLVPEPLTIVKGGRNYEEAWTATVLGSIRRRLLDEAAKARQEEN